MFDFLNISTAYFLAGLVHMISPLVAWTSLHHLRERSITFWLIGTEVFSTGLLLLATRQLTPNWVSFELGNSLLAAGLLLQVHGLSLLTRVQYKQSLMISVGLIHILGYTLAHQLLPQQPAFFIWALLFMAAEMGWICLLAFKLSNTQNLPTARWIILAYAPIVVLLILRALQTTIDPPENAHILHTNSVGTIIALLGLITAILGNIGFMSIFLERANQEVIKTRVREEQEKTNRQLAQKLAQLDSQRSLHKMAAKLSHELGQPMTSIDMLTSMWQSNPAALNANDIIQHIQQASEHATHILKRMRELTQSGALKLQNIDLRELHQQTLELMDDWLRAHHAHIELQAPEQTLHVQADPVQLTQVLINLYRNAVQAAPANSARITVSLAAQGPHVNLRIHDNGPGFSAKQLANPSAITSTKQDGMGLGLNITQDIIEQHHGSIQLSNHPHGGACIDIKLPALA
jgi:signal transduction histidine kinase